MSGEESNREDMTLLCCQRTPLRSFTCGLRVPVPRMEVSGFLFLDTDKYMLIQQLYCPGVIRGGGEGRKVSFKATGAQLPRIHCISQPPATEQPLNKPTGAFPYVKEAIFTKKNIFILW